MSRLRLKLSSEGKELAELNYTQRAREISSGHHARIQQLQGGVRSGATRAAIDAEYLAMARESAQAFVDAYLEEYLKEDKLPDESEQSDIGHGISNIVRTCSANELYTPLASSTEAFRLLPLQLYREFQERVRRLELESKRAKPAAPPAGNIHYTTNIHGPNYGGIQQGGQSNTQAAYGLPATQPASPSSAPAAENKSTTTGDEEAGDKLYRQVLSLSNDWDTVDEAKAQLIIEYANDAIEAFGKTNQDKKVELRKLADRAEQIISPASIDTFKKRAERLILRFIYPKSTKLRNGVLTIAGIILILSTAIPLLLNIRVPEKPSPPAKQKIVVILSDVTISLTPPEYEKAANLTADILDRMPHKTRYAVFPIQAEPARVLPIIPSGVTDTSFGELPEKNRIGRRAALVEAITDQYRRRRGSSQHKSCIINLLTFAKEQLDELSRGDDVDPNNAEYELFILSDMEENCDDTPIGRINLLPRNIKDEINRMSYAEWSLPAPNLSNIRITVIFPLTPESSLTLDRRPKDNQLKEFWRNVFIKCGFQPDWFWDNTHITWISNGTLPSRLNR